MDIPPKVLVKLLLPLTPLILKTVLLNTLHLSANSSKQDARTEVTIAIIRKIASVSRPLSFTQKLSLRDPGIRGPLWISKVTCPAPIETDVLDLLLGAIKELGDGTETFTIPKIAAVEGEWTGHRGCVDKNAARPNLSEADQYKSLMNETTSPATILYFHGGAYFLMDPASHRNTTSHLAKLTGGCCFSVRYRLAPQHPFPAQLLDALVSYLYLLSPPPGSYHEPVPASSIIFSGDSAGGNLAFALSLLITTLIRSGHTTISFHGKAVPLQPPGGVAGNSPWLDVSHALPSIYSYAQYDYLSPPPSAPQPPACSLWPTLPPRAEIYCNANIISHPLVSPLAATPEQWSNHPPAFMVTGYEMLTDSILVTSRRMDQSSTYVDLIAYEGMPHTFCQVFPGTPASKDCFKRWADFCVDAVNGKLVGKKSSASWMTGRSNPPAFTEISFDKLSELGDKDVDKMMLEMKQKIVERDNKEVKAWEEGQLQKKTGSGSSDEASAMVESRAKL